MKITTNFFKKAQQDFMRNLAPALWAKFIKENPLQIKQLPEEMYYKPVVLEAMDFLIKMLKEIKLKWQEYPIKHIIWLIHCVASEKFEGAGVVYLGSFHGISEWATTNNIDLFNYNYKIASEEAHKWKVEEERKIALKNYKTHNVVYKFKDGYEMVKLSDEDIESEEILLNFETDNYAETEDLYSLRSPQNIPQACILVQRGSKDPKYLALEKIIGTGTYNEVSSDARQRITEWFKALKSDKYKIEPLESECHDSPSIEDLPDIGWYDDYGLLLSYSRIGGDQDTYEKNLEEAERQGWNGSYFYDNFANKISEALLDYADDHNELGLFEGALQSYKEKLHDRFYEWESTVKYEHPEPEELTKEGFMITTKNPPGQTEFKVPGMEEKPYFDEEAYNKALNAYKLEYSAYEEERDELANSFEPYGFANHIYKRLQEILAAKEKKNKMKTTQTTQAKKGAKNNMAFIITKKAQSDINIPNAEDLSFYIDTFKLYLKENPHTDDSVKELIKNLPSSKQVRKHFSTSECKLLFETVNYLWRKITGNDINEEAKFEKSPETLSGNYWVFKHGFIFSGKNHYLIIKHNLNLFASMLGLNMFTLQEYLSSDPDKLLFYIIKNGGVRMFIDKDKKAFFQMTPQTYAEWGKERVRRYKFDHKIVRVIDVRADYKGWKSGVAVRLR